MGLAPGSATLTATFQGSDANTSIPVSVEDTYLPTWPRAARASDTSAVVTANMTANSSVTVVVVPSAGLDYGDVSPAGVEAGGGATLLLDATGGPAHFAATLGSLVPGTNYTALLAVRRGTALASGVLALSGLLVPDTAPPSFAAARLVGSAVPPDSVDGRWSVTLDLGLDEPGAVRYALYRDDAACATGARRRPSAGAPGNRAWRWADRGGDHAARRLRTRGSVLPARQAAVQLRVQAGWQPAASGCPMRVDDVANPCTLHPAPMPGQPTAGELRAGSNLNDTSPNKTSTCACGRDFCAAAVHGTFLFAPNSGLRDTVVVHAAPPPNPYAALLNTPDEQLQCATSPDCEPRGGKQRPASGAARLAAAGAGPGSLSPGACAVHASAAPAPQLLLMRRTPCPPPHSLPRPAGAPSRYASRAHALYLLAEDDLPTYRGWSSTCAAPAFNTSAPAGPCDPVTIVPCTNTQTGADAVNAQPLPFQAWDATAAGLSAPAAPPARAPLRVPVSSPDSAPLAFTAAAVAAAGSGPSRALAFSFAVSRPALVRYRLVRNVTEVLAHGVHPVFDAANHTVTIARECATQAQLEASTAYGIWYWATDIYGDGTPLRILSAPLT